MAKQTGPSRLVGTIGNITYYKCGDEYFARQKSQLSRQQVLRSPNYALTRQHMSEFGTAVKANKLLRNAFHAVLCGKGDKKMLGTLTREMLLVIQSDPDNARGRRTVTSGDIESLEGFEFNSGVNLGRSTPYVDFTTCIDRISGELRIDIAGFKKQKVKMAQDATHFRLVAAGAEIDFDKGTYNSELDSSPILPTGGGSVAPMRLSVHVTPGSKHPLFLVLSLQFFWMDGKEIRMISDSSQNATAIVDISQQLSN